jgi:hypothetical protein
VRDDSRAGSLVLWHIGQGESYRVPPRHGGFRGKLQEVALDPGLIIGPENARERADSGQSVVAPSGGYGMLECLPGDGERLARAVAPHYQLAQDLGSPIRPAGSGLVRADQPVHVAIRRGGVSAVAVVNGYIEAPSAGETMDGRQVGHRHAGQGVGGTVQGAQDLCGLADQAG